MPSPIDSWQDAERAAREALIDMGFSGVALTSSGSDGGVDVKADGLVAQVKAYMQGSIGRPEIQQLAGIASVENSTGVFFSLAPYTNEAQAWAEKAGIALFRLSGDGSYRPDNQVAESLGSARTGVPSANSSGSVARPVHSGISTDLPTRRAELLRLHPAPGAEPAHFDIEHGALSLGEPQSVPWDSDTESILFFVDGDIGQLPIVVSYFLDAAAELLEAHSSGSLAETTQNFAGLHLNSNSPRSFDLYAQFPWGPFSFEFLWKCHVTDQVDLDDPTVPLAVRERLDALSQQRSTLQPGADTIEIESLRSSFDFHLDFGQPEDLGQAITNVLQQWSGSTERSEILLKSWGLPSADWQAARNWEAVDTAGEAIRLS